MRKLTVSPSVRIGPWKLVPVELTTIASSSELGYVWATKRLHALVLIDDDTRHAIDVRGNPIPTASLVADVPALEDALED